MTEECCKDKQVEGWIPKAKAIEFIEETGAEIEQAVDEYIKWEATKSKQQDSLELIFEKQKALLNHLEQSKPNSYYHKEERFQGSRMVDLLIALDDEASELRRALSWKWWKDYNVDSYEDVQEDDSYQTEFLTEEDKATQKQLIENTTQEYIQKEVVDMWHFLIQLSIEAGIDAKKLVEMYLEKNETNHKRQDHGY